MVTPNILLRFPKKENIRADSVNAGGDKIRRIFW